jgi:predicted transcriptional regulator
MHGVRRFFLLSIKPQYSERILSGEKKFELRKRKLGTRPGDVVVIYTSSPTRALTGAFIVQDEFEMPVTALWSLHRNDLGIRKEDYAEYFRDRDYAVAISIGRTVTLPPISLDELRRVRPGFAPPQSYMYFPEPLTVLVPPKALRKLLRAA